MISREQVADLQPGDVVELRLDGWPESHAIRTTLRINDHGALVAPIPGDDSASYWITGGGTDRARPFDGDHRTLTIVSRAPRPLYVNHPRTEPVPGDVVREEDPEGATTWLMDSFGTWQSKDSTCKPEHMEGHSLRLLVDGETGQAVQ